MQLKGKCAVVTGASSGMGKSIVELFAKEGCNVVAVARRAERLAALKESLADAPGKVEVFSADVSIAENNDAMIDFCLETFGGFDILINNAGIMDDMAGVADATNEKFDQVMKVNVFGPMCAMRKAVNEFKARGTKGSIVNVVSVGGMRNVAGAIYCASKAALISMTKTHRSCTGQTVFAATASPRAESQQKSAPPWADRIWKAIRKCPKCWRCLLNPELPKKSQKLRSSWQAISRPTYPAIFSL